MLSKEELKYTMDVLVKEHRRILLRKDWRKRIDLLDHLEKQINEYRERIKELE